MTDTKELQVAGGVVTDKKQQAVDEKPSFCGKLIVKCPCLLCVSILVFLIIVIAIDATAFELSENDDRTFLVDNNEYVEKYDAYTLAAQSIGDSGELENAAVLPQTEIADWWLYSHLFSLKDYNDDFDVNNADKTDYWILTKANVEKIIAYENRIYEDPVWRNQFCWAGSSPLESNYTCDSALSSAARMVYNEAGFKNMTTQDIRDYIMREIDLDESMARFFNPGVAETGQTYIYRSFFLAGLPIATDSYTENGSTVHETSFSHAQDNIKAQEQAYIEWGTDVFRELTVDHNGGLVDGDLEILSVSFIVYNSYFMVLLGESTSWIVFSIVIVLVYMSIHLSSVFLSVMALLQILMSFPLAYFVYRFVLQIPYYDTLSTLIIFVLLGVGADDVFVFTDAWRQSLYFVKDTGEPTEEGGCWQNDSKSCVCKPAKETRYLMRRMGFAYRRSAKAMLVTQLTTFFAFLATATSQLMPIAAFGIWAALVVAMNYVLVISIYPTIVIIHEVFIKKYETMLLCFCCRACNKSAPANDGSKSDEPTPATEPENDAPAATGAATQVQEQQQPPVLQRQRSEEETRAEEYRCFEKFLYHQWSACIVRFKYAIMFAFLVLFVVAAILGAQMEAQSEDEKWFATDHYMQRSIDKSGEFSASETDNLIGVTLTFGIEGVDRGTTSRWNPAEYGSVVFQNDFDISSPEAQTFLLALCADLKDSDLVYANNLVECPMEQFRDYVEFIGETFPYVNDEEGDANATFGAVYNDFIASSYSTYASLSFVDYDAETEDYVIRFYAMHAPTKVVWEAHADEHYAARDAFDDYIAVLSATCPGTVCRYVGNVTLRWCWLATQKAFVRSALQGILIAMPLAFLILLLSTRNWIISVFAVVDIIGIMLCELSVMYLHGWKFGVSESIAIVIIIGFSVDYVVHLANSYLESTATDRVGRLSFALLTMGISVVSGAVTTFFAGFFLIFPPIVFFYKMGILMITTVSVSIIWAMCFFTAIVAAWGPENDDGNLKACLVCCGIGGKHNNQDAAVRSTSNIERDTYQNYEGRAEHKGYAFEVA